MQRTGLLLGLATVLGAAAIAAGNASVGAKDPVPAPDFRRDVRPILSDACFSCHGPDEKKRRADLRLDTREGILEDLGGTQAVVPGRSAESEIIRRISAEDPRDRMPPRASGKTLRPEQIEVLKRWIDAGAPWRDHWSLEPPARPEPPRVARDAWPRNDIDRFILARLEAEGLEPSPEADPTTLLRRVSLDLTGLPPSPEAVDAFAADGSRDAYEKAVDGLLDSPDYGERMALHWLDLARYADTHGYHIDSHRDMWRWRDWTIQAFQENKPFDQFTLEQLAGDLLPDPTTEQRIATGFHRNNMVNFEGGAIPEEYHVQYVVDRVNTTATVFLGMTMGCAQCHDHKYDPVSRKEFYSFFAFFNNVPENGLDGSRGNAVPFLAAPTREQQGRMSELRRAADETRGELAKLEAALGPAQAEWERTALSSFGEPPTTGLLAHFELEGSLDDASGAIHGATAGGPDPVYGPGKSGRGLTLDGNQRIEVPGCDLERTDAFSYGAWVRPEGGGHMAVLARMEDASAFRGFDLYLGDGKVFVHLIHEWEKDAIRVNTKAAVSFDVPRHVFVTYDGSGKAAGLTIFVDGRPQPVDVTHDSLKGSIRVSAPLRLGGRNPGAPFRGLLDDVRIYSRRLEPSEVETLALREPVREVLSRAPEARSDADRALLRTYYLAANAPAAYRDLTSRAASLEAELRKVEGEVVTTMVMQEMETPRETFVLERGQYDQRGEKVQPDTPSCLPPLPPEAPRNRLGLARWLLDPRNPRTARVTVNRFWQMLFGTGLVKTSEDFGSQGELPVHPELLDWLATEFVRTGWDTKALLRLIVTSATYRQSSRTTPELLERDPENRLLARGPRIRLPAELIRDLALHASGLLVRKVGGPSVKPYQPAGLWSDVAYGGGFTAQVFEQDHGEALYRKSMYTFWKRSSPPPQMSTFDAPDRETCTVRRSRTNTPLQALVLLNDVQSVEAARCLAQRVLKEVSDTEGRIERAFRLVLSRRPDADEAALLRGLLETELATYRADPDAARKLVSFGESPPDEAIDPLELAAWTILGNVLLNVDEAVTKH